MIEFPLPLRWATPAASILRDPPIHDHDEVVVRAGPRLLALSAVDGSPRWSVDLGGGSDRGGNVLGLAGKTWFTDISDGDQRTLVGVTEQQVAWRCPLGPTISRRGGVVAGGAIACVMAVHNQPSTLVWVEPATGNARRLTLPARGSTVAARGDDVIVFSATANPDAPGAYQAGRDGAPARVFRTGDVWLGAIAGDALLTAGSRRRDHHVVEVCDLVSGAARWSADCHTEVAAIDGEDVAHVTRDASSTQLVLRDATTGETRWMVEIGGRDPVTLVFAANVLVLRHVDGALVVRRRDGQVIGDAEGSFTFGASSTPNHLYMAGCGHAFCAELPPE